MRYTGVGDRVLYRSIDRRLAKRPTAASPESSTAVPHKLIDVNFSNRCNASKPAPVIRLALLQVERFQAPQAAKALECGVGDLRFGQSEEFERVELRKVLHPGIGNMRKRHAERFKTDQVFQVLQRGILDCRVVQIELSKVFEKTKLVERTVRDLATDEAQPGQAGKFSTTCGNLQ